MNLLVAYLHVEYALVSFVSFVNNHRHLTIGYLSGSGQIILRHLLMRVD